MYLISAKNIQLVGGAQQVCFMSASNENCPYQSFSSQRWTEREFQPVDPTMLNEPAPQVDSLCLGTKKNMPIESPYMTFYVITVVIFFISNNNCYIGLMP